MQKPTSYLDYTTNFLSYTGHLSPASDVT
ncbi:rCG39104 [Rattus norvegicus]|uniref:RCG39104 n=1 Tax=Rattus norvegicus TaxID=10116 RepID=A6JXZ1_RAT|nr:rCG39104 [Rattus norvegicus]